MKRTNRLLIAGLVLWGAALALWLARVYFLHPEDCFHENHETNTYAGRLVEFRDLLGEGHLSPQWCGHFRGGLGAPYFSYYQPGFFYAASLVPWPVPPVRALGVTVAAFLMLGYLGMLGLVGRRFGRFSGWLAATAFCASPYACTEVAIRGDLSELAAMMVLPAALWALVEWFEGGKPGAAVGLAVAGAALVVLHPVVGLLGYALLGLATLVYGISLRQLLRTLGAIATLVWGVCLAAFYWMPVFLEMDLVQADGAFAGFYHYAHHFIDPRELFQPYSRLRRTIPLSLGLLPLGLACMNTGLLYARWPKATPGQRRLLLFALGAAVPFVFLMTGASEPIWQWFPLLERIQFPWRILTVVTMLLAVAAGSMLPWRHERVRVKLVAMLVVALAAFSYYYTAYELAPQRHAPGDAQSLAAEYFAPDLANEWLPRGAEADIPAADRQAPAAEASCRITDYRRGQGRLSCRVQAQQASSVTLPHYAFPIGWSARLGDRPIAIGSDPRGLMRLEVPAATDARLEVIFSTTPARRWGLIVSGIALLVGLAVLVVLGMRRRPVAAD